MKLIAELETIFKYRVVPNETLDTYINRMAQYGKMDLPRQVALYALILNKLQELEKLGDAVKTTTSGSVQQVQVKLDQLGNPVRVVRADPEKAKAQRLDNLAKARETQRLKREAQKATA